MVKGARGRFRVHSDVYKMFSTIEKLIKKHEDPVKGTFTYDITEPWTLIVDSSLFAHGVMLYIG